MILDVVKFDIDMNNLTTDVIQQLVDFHRERLLPRYVFLQKYYELHHKIDHKGDNNLEVKKSDKPNNKLINDYPGYIVGLSTGYFMGKPIAYSTKDTGNEEYIEKLQSIFDGNDESDIDSELAKTCSIQGEAFELVYIDEDSQPAFVQLKNEETLLVYNNDIKPKPILGVRHYVVQTPSAIDSIIKEKVVVYTDKNIFYYDYNIGGLALTGSEAHYFGAVPIIHYKNNKELMGDFEPVITLIDAYDNMESDSMDDFDYFTDAYLMLKNMSETDVDDIKDMKKNRVILVDENGDAKWLIKDINDTAVENFKHRLNADIHKFSKIVDLSDENFGGDLSGVAIRFKLFCLEQLTVMKERKFKKALQRRIELITNILNIKGGNYIYTDIDMSFTRNIPANTTELVNMVTQLKGTLSEQTLISQLPFVADPQSELEKVKKQQESSLDYKFLQDNQAKANSNSNKQNGDVNE